MKFRVKSGVSADVINELLAKGTIEEIDDDEYRLDRMESSVKASELWLASLKEQTENLAHDVNRLEYQLTLEGK